MQEVKPGLYREPDILEFDPDKVFDCGQCFRFNRGGDGVWRGIAGGRAGKVWMDSGSLYIRASQPEDGAFWRTYLDLDRDYTAIRHSLMIDDYMTRAGAYGAGIRILRQDPWEALCTFILSQCNNIPRIKGLAEGMAKALGRPVELEGEVYHTFPTAGQVARLSLEELAPVRAGFRAKYVLAAARAVDSGDLDMQALAQGEYTQAVERLKTLPGIGDKVANCVVLFGLHHLDAFPVDVWMKRAISGHYDETFDPGVFGAYAGIAQQYMFYYARWEEGAKRDEGNCTENI